MASSKDINIDEEIDKYNKEIFPLTGNAQRSKINDNAVPPKKWIDKEIGSLRSIYSRTKKTLRSITQYFKHLFTKERLIEFKNIFRYNRHDNYTSKAKNLKH